MKETKEGMEKYLQDESNLKSSNIEEVCVPEGAADLSFFLKHTKKPFTVFGGGTGIAGEVGARRLVAWTGGYSANLMQADERNFSPGAADAIVRFLEPHLARLAAAGLTVALESYITLVCPDAPSLRRLLDRLPPAVGAVLDPPNLTPVARYAERDAVLREMVHTLAGRIAVVHMKDFRLAANGRYDLPGPLQGEMNYRLFLELIGTLPADVPMVAEHLKPEQFSTARRQLLALAARY
jgi:sugar phosphate isomerase/epimerase